MKKIAIIAAALALVAGPAHAGPVAAAVAWVGKVLAANTLMGIAARMVVSAGLSLLSQALMKKPSQPGSDVQFDIKLGDEHPLTFVVGDYVTAGKRKYLGSWGTNTRFITEVIEVSALPQGLSGLWVDDEPGVFVTGRRGYVPASASPSNIGNITEGATVPGGALDLGTPLDNYRDNADSTEPRIWVKWINGTQTAADPLLTWAFGGDPDYPWTAAMIGTGKSYAIVTTQYDHDTLLNYPTYLFQPAPLAVYDPRLDSTNGGSGPQRWNNPATWQPSRNPAVIAYNIARGIYYGGEWVFGGRNLPAWRLPVAEWIAAANECDASEPLAGGGSEPAYRCGAEISVDMAAADVLEEIGRAGNMRFAEVGGQLKPVVGLPGAAVYSFTDDEIIITEGQSFRPFVPVSETFNAISATYPEPAEKWATKDSPEYIDTDATADDGDRYLPTSISYPAAPFAQQVQRLQRSMLQDYRRMRRHQFHLPPEAYSLEPGVDMVSWTSQRNGYISKLFVVESVAKTPGMNVLVSLREVDPSDYDWSSDFEMPVVITPPKGPSPYVQNVPGLTFTAASIRDGAGQPRRPAILAACSSDQTGVTDIQIQARVAGEDITIDTIRPYVAPHSWYLRDVLPDTLYQCRARLMSRLTPKSPWSTWHDVATLDITLTIEDMADDILEEMKDVARRAGVTPVESLPASGEPNQIVMLVPDGVLYRWDEDAGEWTTAIYAGIPDGAIDPAKFAQGIEPVTIITDPPLPTTKSTELIFYVPEGKQYRWNGTAYISSIPVVDLDGQLIGDQLEDSAVTPAKLAVIPGHNLVTDPKMLIQAEWFLQNSVAAWTYSPGKWSLNLAAIVSTPNLRNRVGGVPIGAGLRYRSSFTVTNTTATQCNVRTGFFWYDENGAYINATWGAYQVVNGSTPVVISADLNALTGAKFAAAAIQFNTSGAANDGIVEVSQPEMIHINSSDTIADSAITTAKIVNDAINAAKIANNAVEAAKIAAGAVTETKISDNAITTPKVVAGAIETSKIAAGAVAADKIAANAVEAAKIAAGAVTTAKLDALAVTAEKVAAGAIETNKLAANSVTAAKILAGAIETAKLAANAVTADKILAGAITTIKLDALAVTADKLAVNAVTADKIAANAITVGKIAAGAVGADQIAANAIAARHLMVADFTNLVPNADISDAPSWTIPAAWSRGNSGPYVRSGYWLYIDVATGETGNSPTVISQRFSVEVGSEYLGRFQARTNGPTQTGHVNVNVQWFDNSDTSLGFGSIHNASVTNIVTDYSAILTPPANAVRAEFRMTVNRTNSDGRIYIASPEIRRRNGGELIVEGAITTNKLAAGSVTADAIAAGAIVASAIATGAVTAAKIAASAITTIKLAAGAVTADKITVANLSALGITVGSADIATAAITSAKIADLSVGTIKIANNAISTYRQAYTAGNITIGANQSGVIQTLTVTPGRSGPLKIDFQFLRAGAATGFDVRLVKNGNVMISDDLAPGRLISNRYVLSFVDVAAAAGVSATYTVEVVVAAGGGNFIASQRFLGALDIIK
ncbi:hypothetical protein JWJ88_08640 [Paracoccus methylovorus]|uniref:Tip attachment protein J domain-containing protein n=1 Tax=Paracoccus methylovorus TaxID=2812658 RepID=A0ABX7JGF3_9RHOB|nr:phage tail protein [Paracoccus methylovorus]QRZ12676.1 hypothetical protein JWJ88_08640 [Paracoccus methylovorus]